MSAVAAIPAVRDLESRIAVIRGRLATTGVTVAAPSISDPTFVEADPTGFDPFGEAYQAAVEAVRNAPLPAAAAPATSYGVASAGSGGAVYTGVAPVGAVATAPVGVEGSSIGRIGGYGSLQIPPELAAYGNGRLPASALEPIGQGGHRLYGPAAAAWSQAVEAAAAEGVTLRVTDSYRTYDQQVDLAARKGLYSEGGWAATPGTSNHGWGMAVDADVSDPATLTWIRANGWKFGFVEAVPREPWHWEYRPSQA